MKECNICYNSIKRPVFCFNGCSFEMCNSCFKQMIEFRDGDVCYACPMCRTKQVYQQSPRFTKFINKSRDLLKKIVDLTYTQSITDIEWNRFIYEQYPMFQAYMEDEIYREHYLGVTILSPATTDQHS